jgi:hypothetical protein
MWQAPNQRVRAQANARKRERERVRRGIHIKRVRAEIKTVGELAAPALVTQARVLLNDFSPKGVGVFAHAPIIVGQLVSLTLEEPKRFYVKGRVVWCQEYAMESHVLSETPFHYRMGIEFVFETPEEEQQVKDYCEALGHDHLRMAV